jgi:putative FmdB family regulatory protein
MPIYEYHCAKCGDFEVMQKISDKPLTNCPTCRRKVNKLISSTSFQLKGSGWYVTDYARKGSTGANSKSDDKAAKSDDKSSAGEGTSKADSTSTTEGTSSKKSGGTTKAAAA